MHANVQLIFSTPLGGIVPRSIPRPSMGLGLVEIERTTSNEAECKNTPNQATQNTENRHETKVMVQFEGPGVHNHVMSFHVTSSFKAC